MEDPHPGIDTAVGSPLPFNLIVDADKAVSNKVSASQSPFKRPHPSGGHYDKLVRADLVATVTSTAFFDDITGYTFTSRAEHVPLPSTVWLTILGLLSLIVSSKKQK